MEHQGFPQYRRMSGGSSLYCITSVDRFEEMQRLGTKWLRHEVRAVAYPELLRIAEMLACRADTYEVIAEAEYQAAATIAV